MKIRWTHDSVRFRIGPSELETLQRGERLTERMSFPAGTGWIASIAPNADSAELRGTGSEVTLYLPVADLERLVNPEAEGVYFRREGEHSVSFYIEKDFPCAHPRVTEVQENETETFVPPDGFNARKAEQ